jgi:hypothetical protein
MPLYYEATSYNSLPDNTSIATSLLTLPINKSFFVLFVLVIGWQEHSVAIKKDYLPPFVKVKALLFSI